MLKGVLHRASLKRLLFQYARKSRILRDTWMRVSSWWFKIKVPFLLFQAHVKEGHIRAEDVILKRYPGHVIPAEAERKVCVFAHYDPHHIVDGYVIYYIQALFNQGFEIFFISSSPQLREVDLESLRRYCVQIYLKKNIGYDFGSWRIGIEAVGEMTSCSQIVLANDSVYGPLFPLSEMFEAMKTRSYDLWGVTDSYGYGLGHHLQSYFLVFGSEIIRSVAFKKYWESYRFYSSKDVVIYKYEVGITRYFKDQFRIGVYCDYDTTSKIFLGESSHHIFRKRIQAGYVNPVNFFWKELIIDGRCPFLKKELIRTNALGAIGTSGWFQLIHDRTGYDPILISNHLQRIGVGANYEL